MKKHSRLLLAVLISTLSLGASAHDELQYSPTASLFKVQTLPSAKEVLLRIYPEGIGGSPERVVKMKKQLSANKELFWNVRLKGDLKGKFYTFDVRYDKKFMGETPGVNAKAVGVNGHRGAIIDMQETNPVGWESDRRPNVAAKDLVIYEMHHRDFSVGPGVEWAYKGKYLALTEPQAIKHLTELGVNAVHILPSFDYASVDETILDKPQFNWGYDPQNYNVPDGSYSTNPRVPQVRINEFKQMVQALHKAGIKVILDVVYNHTFNIESSNFQLTMPDAFFRKQSDGSYSNGSGCGNETGSEKPVMRNFMLESVKYWVDEYHIDGFRFDLMGVHDIETMNFIRQTLPNDIFIYGEGWSAGSCAWPADLLASKANMRRMPGIAAFCDDMRDALRGPYNDDTKGAFLAGFTGHEESIKAGIAGCIEHEQIDYDRVNYSKEAWCKEPTQMLAYVSCHDDMCLADRLRSSIPGIGEEELIRLDLLAQTVVFTSQGVPFMLSGEEMLRTKKGVHNSYNSPDSINQLNWNNLQKYSQVFDYYKNLIALRKHHSAFRMGSTEQVRKHLEFLPIQDCLVAFRLKDHAGGDVWKDIYVAFNSGREMRYVEVPEGFYTIVCAYGEINEKGLGTISGSKLLVPAQSALIVHN